MSVTAFEPGLIVRAFWYLCGHLNLDPDEGNNCPVCADIEKRVKAARVEALGKAMPKILNYLVVHIDEDSNDLYLDRREFVAFSDFLGKLIEAEK